MQIDTAHPNYYLLIGDPDNWDVAIKNHVWGYTDRSKGFWNTSKKGDLVAFYAIKPIQRVFGFGVVIDKMDDHKLLWNDEKVLKRALWHWRIEFKILAMTKYRKNGVRLPKNMILGTSRKRIDKELYMMLVSEAEKYWKTKITLE